MNKYKTWKIPKKDGTKRQIESPTYYLKEKQRTTLKKTLTKKLRLSPFAHAFTYYKNIVTMAQPHVGKKWVACIDIEDFFPSIKRVEFSNWLTTKELNLCFHNFKDKKGFRLPQGAPTSPFLSNAYLYFFDWRMAWLCYRFKCDYTRYADDIVISGNTIRGIKKLLMIAEHLLYKWYNLKVNKKKTKIMHNNRRQIVCGIVVNEKINISKKYKKNLRAEIFQSKLKMSKSAKMPIKNISDDQLNWHIQGRINFIKMITKSKKTTMSSMTIIERILILKKLKKEI